MDKTNYCYTCKKIYNKLYYCGGCKTIQYCSIDCQKLDWKNHKISCQSCIDYNPPLNLANNFYLDKDYNNAVKWYFIAGEKKSYIAYLLLSDLYIFGYGVDRNLDKAREMDIKATNIIQELSKNK